MRTRTTLAAALLALAALTAGCSSDSSPDDKPTTTAVAEPTAAADPAEARQACVDAVAELPAGDNGEVPSSPVPEACAGLDEGDYLDAYYDGIEQSNQAGLDELQDLIDEASEAAQP